jgi:hypothetical protein
MAVVVVQERIIGSLKTTGRQGYGTASYSRLLDSSKTRRPIHLLH